MQPWPEFLTRPFYDRCELMRIADSDERMPNDIRPEGGFSRSPSVILEEHDEGKKINWRVGFHAFFAIARFAVSDQIHRRDIHGSHILGRFVPRSKVQRVDGGHDSRILS
jgi:hypothetical protein